MVAPSPVVQTKLRNMESWTRYDDVCQSFRLHKGVFSRAVLWHFFARVEACKLGNLYNKEARQAR